MAELFQVFNMSLGGRRVELHKGFVVELARDGETFVHVRVTTLEEANRLEATASQLHGQWQPNYRFNAKDALSVDEFAQRITENPRAFERGKPPDKTPVPPEQSDPARRRTSTANALDKIRSFGEAREADHVVVRDGLTYGDCRAIAALVQRTAEDVETILERARSLEKILVRT
jgi:hypothetical protein